MRARVHFQAVGIKNLAVAAFVAGNEVDVETANKEPESICAIGAVKVINGIITERFYELAVRMMGKGTVG